MSQFKSVENWKSKNFCPLPRPEKCCYVPAQDPMISGIFFNFQIKKDHQKILLLVYSAIKFNVAYNSLWWKRWSAKSKIMIKIIFRTKIFWSEKLTFFKCFIHLITIIHDLCLYSWMEIILTLGVMYKFMGGGGQCHWCESIKDAIFRFLFVSGNNGAGISCCSFAPFITLVGC